MDLTEEFLRESNAIEDVFDDISLEDAQVAWKFLLSQEILTPAVIRATHGILMEHQDLLESEKGSFRTVDVWVGGHKGITPISIPIDIRDFCDRTMRQNPDWKALHVYYERIHPFVDGNGRTGRMFLNWTRVKRCGLGILVITRAARQSYYKWFQ